MRALSLLIVLALAACDGSYPGPEPTNDFDPLSDRPEAPYYPSDLAVTPSAAGAVALTWADRSAFETGYAIERRSLYSPNIPSLPGGYSYEVVGVAPPNATSYSDTSAEGAGKWIYRVRPLGGDSYASGTAAAALTPELSFGPDETAAAMTIVGGNLFVRQYDDEDGSSEDQTVAVYDPVTGDRLRTMTLRGTNPRLIGVDECYATRVGRVVRVYTADGTQRLRVSGNGDAHFALSADCSRLAVEGPGNRPAVYDVASGDLVASGLDLMNDVFSLNGDGTVIVGQDRFDRFLIAVRVSDGAVLWSVLLNVSTTRVVDETVLVGNGGQAYALADGTLLREGFAGGAACLETLRDYLVTCTGRRAEVRRLSDLSLVQTFEPLQPQVTFMRRTAVSAALFDGPGGVHVAIGMRDDDRSGANNEPPIWTYRLDAPWEPVTGIGTAEPSPPDERPLAPEAVGR